MAEIQDFDVVDAGNTARWPEGMAPSAINNAARADEGILARWYEDSDGSITSSGSANAYAITSKRTISSLVNNTVMAWTANHTNTGASTLVLNGLTAKSIKRPNGDALEANDIVSGQPVITIYKSSPDEWRMLSPGAFAASDTVVGGVVFATAALMEAGTSVVTAVTPGRQHRHPGHPKAWGYVTAAGTLTASHNVASAVLSDTSLYTITLTTALSTANYAVIASPSNTGSGGRIATVNISSASVFLIRVSKATDASNQPADIYFAVFGDIGA